MPIVSKLEDLQSLYEYFLAPSVLNSPSLLKLFKKGFKVLQNVKMRWINMMQPLKHFGKEYKTFIVKMVANCGSMEFAKANLLNLCHIILSVLFIFPMLEF